MTLDWHRVNSGELWATFDGGRVEIGYNDPPKLGNAYWYQIWWNKSGGSGGDAETEEEAKTRCEQLIAQRNGNQAR